MSASDNKQVLNFDNNFETATRGVLVGGGYSDAFIEGKQTPGAELPASRIEIVFATGEATNQAVLPNGQMVYDFYTGKLTLRIVTFRPDDQPSLLPGVSSMHSEWSAGVRDLMQERMIPFGVGNLPYYSVQTIRPMATTRDLDPKWLEDFTKLEFFVEFGIRTDAWAA